MHTGVSTGQTMGMALQVPLFTIDMLDSLPDDGSRYELVEGMLIVTPAPSVAHQAVATRFAAVLTRELDERRARVFAGGAIQRGERTQLQPDVLVAPAHFPLSADWREIDGWWLAIEVLSPSSRIYDREIKRGAYLALGVVEVWLADLRDCSVEVWGAGMGAGRRERGTLRWRPPALDAEIAIDLGDIFREICDDPAREVESPG